MISNYRVNGKRLGSKIPITNKYTHFYNDQISFNR